jgi:flagellar biosynthesis protein FliQ
MYNAFTYVPKIVYVFVIVTFLHPLVDKSHVSYCRLEAVMFRHDS